MDPIEIQQANTEVDMRGLLQPLINVLNCIPENPRNAIVEIDYLSEFPWYDVMLPEVDVSPRQITEYMITTHTLIENDILVNSDHLKIITYKYWNRGTNISQQFTFSNNMSLAADICIICYIYNIKTRHNYFFVKTILDLYYMMINKYLIQSDNMMQIDPSTITEFRITCCFPNISFPWYGYDPDINKLASSSHFMHTTFLGLNLRQLIWHPMIASLIPRLENSKFVPIALLTAISVTTNHQIAIERGPNFEDYSLNVIYQRILALSHSKAFPVRLKLKLCTKWGIVYRNIEGVFKYSDYFANYRLAAMNVISVLKSQDPDLQTILSQM